MRRYHSTYSVRKMLVLCHKKLKSVVIVRYRMIARPCEFAVHRIKILQNADFQFLWEKNDHTDESTHRIAFSSPRKEYQPYITR